MASFFTRPYKKIACPGKIPDLGFDVPVIDIILGGPPYPNPIRLPDWDWLPDKWRNFSMGNFTGTIKVGRCRLTVSKSVLKPRLVVSALETKM